MPRQVPLSATPEYAEANAWNDEGSRLVHDGDYEAGLTLLSRSSRFGMPWALSSFTWWCLLREDFSRGLREYEASSDACESTVVRLQEEAHLAGVARVQLANAKSNVALLKLATGGSLEEALATWNLGAVTGHAESLFYPALVADKLGKPDEADALVRELPLSTWLEMKQTLTEGIEQGGWFGKWCTDGMVVLGRNQPSISLPHPSQIDIDEVLSLPKIRNETMPESLWEAVTAAIQGSADAEAALRAFADGGDASAWVARMELGTLLSDPNLRPGASADEGLDLLAMCLQAPYQDLIATAAWNLSLTPAMQGQPDIGAGFMHLALALGDGTAMRSIAERFLEEGDESSAVDLFERAIEELPFGDVNRAQSHARLAALKALEIREPFSTWFTSHQGAVSLDSWSQFASITALQGDFNVDTAQAAIATRYFEDCPSACYFDEAPRDCWDCGRTETSFLHAASGHGDGGYNVLNILGPFGSLELDHVGVFIPFLEEDRFNMEVVGMGRQFADIIVSGAPLVLGTLACTGELFVFDAAKLWDDSDVSLRIEAPEDEYVVVCWLRPEMDLMTLMSNRLRSGQALTTLETDPLTCIAMAAVRGPLAQVLMETSHDLTDLERERFLTELWDSESRSVRALIADIRPQVLAGMAGSESDDELATSYLLQFAERERDGEDACSKIQTSGRVGSYETLNLLAQRGFLEPNLPWWRPDMARDAQDIWATVLEARADLPPQMGNIDRQSVWVRRSLARRLDLSPGDLDTLARDPDARVRRSVASNSSTPGRILAFLADDSEPSVVSAVAANTTTPVETLEGLARQDRAPIGGLAGNQNTPSSVLAILLRTAPKSVRATIAGRLDLPPDLASQLSTDARSVRSCLAGNQSCPSHILETLARDESDVVRSQVARNPTTPDSTLLDLALDSAQFVREGVMGNPSASDTTRARASLIGTPPPAQRQDDTAGSPATPIPTSTATGVSVSGAGELGSPGSMTFCTNCGARRSPENKFCGSCGEPLEAADHQTPQPNLAELAVDPREEVRGPATESIISAVDIDAMTRAGNLALERGDVERAEFWYLEVATAEADDSVRSEGVELLCRHVLLPAGRREEAALYSRYAANNEDPRIRSRALRTLADIEESWAESGSSRLKYSEAWREVDVTGPMPTGLSQHEQYLRLLAYLFAKDGDENSRKLFAGLQEDYMQHITGYILGMSGGLSRLGMERETAVKAVSDWLENR